MIRLSSYALALVVTVTAVLFYMDSSKAWGFNMFSFFSKKSKEVASSVHPDLGTTLTALSKFPLESLERRNDSCTKAKVEREPTMSLNFEADFIQPMQTAFVWDAGGKSVGLINNQDDGRFDVWELDHSNEFKPTKIRPYDSLDVRSDSWIAYSVVDIACLSDQRLLVAVNYYDPRSKIALYIYDASQNTFSLFSEAEPHAQDLDRYFEQLEIDKGHKMIVYYSDTKRQSAEIYHNYYNNLVLFSERYPTGLELLKLGIDDGNIKNWQVVGNQLYIHAVDNRNNNSPKTYYWSLDISKVLVD